MARPTIDNSYILKEWLSKIPYSDRQIVLDRICEECLISQNVLANWRYARSKIPLSGLRDINRVAMEYSGEKIFK